MTATTRALRSITDLIRIERAKPAPDYARIATYMERAARIAGQE